jgi:hypothetical protein
MDAEGCLYALLGEIDRYLAALTPVCPEVGRCRDGLAALKLSPQQCRPLASRSEPGCGSFSEALALAREQGSASLVDMIERTREHLTWTTYAYPGQTIGPRFAQAHAFAELVGCRMPFDAPDYSLGLFLMAPATFYRDHRHKAPELYAPLTGPTLWRFDHGPWLRRTAHQPIWNEAGKVHATIVEEAPFLCIYVWTRDVSEPACVVAAPDWAEIEQRL